MTIQNALNSTLFVGVGGTKIRDTGGAEATGDIFYLNANKELIRLGIGTSGQAIVSSGTVPSWGAPTPGGNAGGDLTGTFPNATIAADAVTYAKMQNVTTARILGRVTAGFGDCEELTASQVSTLLGLGTAATVNTGTASGNVPVLDGSGLLNTSVIPPLALNSIQVVANQAARLALANVQPGDCAKQADNGLTYMLSVLPAATDANWIPIGDTTIDAADIVSGTIATARLGSGTANTTTYLRGDGSWQPVATGSTPRVQVTGTTQAMANNTIYHVTGASKATLTLPATASIGDRIEIWGVGAGGWAIAQNASQQIRWLNTISTAGVTGKVDTQLPTVGVITPQANCVLECVTANVLWMMSANGQLDVA